MAAYTKGRERNREIVHFFYTLFGHWIREGQPPGDAKNNACDAVSLRYGISKGRLLNIISAQKCCPDKETAAFRCDAISLMGDLSAANAELERQIGRNKLLMELLEEYLNEK